MRKISNTEESNQYYKLVNDYIDEYIKEWKIKPSKLKQYFSNSTKMGSFLRKYKLDDVENIKRVVQDVIDDHLHIEKDGIVTFEKFNLYEGLGKINIEPINVNYERALADLYDTSVGHVEITDEKEHKYKVVDFGKEVHVIVYSEKDILEFKKSLIPILIEDAKKNQIELFKADLGLESGKKIKVDINFNVENVIDSDGKLQSLIEKLLTKEKLVKTIFHFINDYDVLSKGNHYVYKEEYKSYHVWELKSRK